MKKALSVVMCLCLIISTVALTQIFAIAEEGTTDYLDYEILYDDTAEITGYDFSSFEPPADFTGHNITIPNEIDGYTVTSIDDFAFSYCDSLTSISIPDSVTSIGDCAFYECTSLTSINVDSNNQYYLSENGVLFNKLKTNIICYPAGITNSSYTIPNSVQSIGEGAFYGCTPLTSISIPDSVQSIGDGAFNDTGYYYDKTNWEDNVLYIGKYLINGSNVNSDYTIKDGTRLIADDAFSYCDSLTSIIVPNSVQSIGNYAFYNCNSLASITISDSLTGIGDKAFYGCTPLTSISIPDSVQSIGDSAFHDCTSLTSITIGDSVTSIAYEAFYNTGYYNDKTNWEDSVLYIGKYLIKASYSDYDEVEDAYAIKDGTKLIADNAFSDCTSLTNISIPDSVQSIGEDSFRNCTSLTSISIPDSVQNIAYGAFATCKSLASISIPDSVTSIGDYAFYGCHSLTSISILESVQSIGDYAFYNCKLLKSVTIGDSLQSIGDTAFSGCTSFASINIPDSVKSIGDYAFSDCTSLTGISIPESVQSIGDYAFSGCTSLTSATIGNGLQNIGNYAFSDCTLLTSVNIPDSVKSIGDYAFGYCFDDEDFNYNLIDGFKIYGYSGTEAERYANKNGIEFVSLGQAPITQPTTPTQPTQSTVEPSSAGHTHTLGEWETTKEATCTEAGEKVKKCTVCNEIIETEEIEVLGHTYTTKVVKPTCTAKGYTNHVCSVCGDSYKDKYTNALGHSYKWVTTTKATYFAYGKMSYKCSHCGKVYKTSTIAKLVLKKPNIKVTAGNKKVTVKYAKVKGAKKYEVSIKIGKKWYKYTTAKTSYTKSKLKKGTKYQVKVRALTTSGKKKVYSKFSSIKSIKAK